MVTLSYSQIVQVCQNCPAGQYDRCIKTVVPGVVSSDDCYNHLNTSGAVPMVSFDPLGTCWAFDASDCMEPMHKSSTSLSDHGAWSAVLSNDIGNDLTSFFGLFKKYMRQCENTII